MHTNAKRKKKHLGSDTEIIQEAQVSLYILKLYCQAIMKLVHFNICDQEVLVWSLNLTTYLDNVPDDP